MRISANLKGNPNKLRFLACYRHNPPCPAEYYRKLEVTKMWCQQYTK